jgi:peptidoglycan/LPS O-acetylase OafA/YrhL
MALDPELFSDPTNKIRQPQSMSASQWFGNLTLTETWRYHLFGDEKVLLAGHIWTLCYEEQFYFVTGTMCYSLYLVHWPVVLAIARGLYLGGIESPEQALGITVPLCVVASLVAGWTFHIFVERRFLNAPQSVWNAPSASNEAATTKNMPLAPGVTRE